MEREKNELLLQEEIQRWKTQPRTAGHRSRNNSSVSAHEYYTPPRTIFVQEEVEYNNNEIYTPPLGSPPISNLATMSLPIIEHTISGPTFGSPPASRYSAITERKQLSSSNKN